VRDRCVFTIVRDEEFFFPLWLKYYRQYFEAQDIYVLDHDSIGDSATQLLQLQREVGFHHIPVHNSASFSHRWLLSVVSDFTKFLHNSYRAMLFAEVDELIATRPGGVYQDLPSAAESVAKQHRFFKRCSGFEVVHRLEFNEQPLDLSQPNLLSQRSWWFPSLGYSKPVLLRKPVEWTSGFHLCMELLWIEETITVPGRDTVFVTCDPDLYLIHLNKIDMPQFLKRNELHERRKWDSVVRRSHAGLQSRATSYNEALPFFQQTTDGFPIPWHPIPDWVKTLV
jgi:hypothetical protein